MGYGINEKKVPLYKKIWFKFWYGMSHFPLNSIRGYSLRRCGYKVGENLYYANNVVIATIMGDERCMLEIGDRVAIGNNSAFVLASDATWSKLSNVYLPIRTKIIVEDDVWIGIGVVILPGVKIGKCSIVGAGSIVTKDVPPYSVVVGNPARVIKNIDKTKLQ